MTKRELTQNEIDLLNAICEPDSRNDQLLRRWAESKLRNGIDPADMGALIRYHSDRIGSWCIGRFGRGITRVGKSQG